ncbi:MAG: DUF4369 domain-containing protein [Bacteroidales bacterium]|nr:DUF4369 domain-containing protein [Bacteroidales bacterium]
MVYLCYYYAQHEKIFDSAIVDRKGRFVFEGSRRMPDGMYFFNSRDGRRADFVVFHEKPQFRFVTDNRDWQRNMVASGSKQNEVFFNFNRVLATFHDELDEARRDMDSATFAAFRLRRLHQLDTVRMQFIEQYPEAMVSRMMMATRDPAAPPDSVRGNDRYFYVMHHFFDNVPLDEDFILRTPRNVFYDRLSEYVDKRMHGLTPELAIPLLDSLIDRSEPSPEVFKYLVHTLTEKYLQSNIMVYDEIYVHLINRYYASGKAVWAEASWLDKELERASKWERLLVGREAPELILFDTTHRAYSLHHMPGRYTLLLFWSPSCGHCREIIPDVYSRFVRVADSLDMTAFAILSEPDEGTTVKWKKFIHEHGMDSPRWIHLHGGEANVNWRDVYDITSTPQIFLIENKTHKFVAKKMGGELFDQICRHLQ